MNPNELSGPCAAVIYGRGRRIGPLLRGEQITTRNLCELLYVIGGSCECGLDRAWLLGTMVPLRWDAKTQSRVAKQLGFDPENPMVKAEVSRILSSGPSSGLQRTDTMGSQQSWFDAYREEEMEFEDGADVAMLSPFIVHALASAAPTLDEVVEVPASFRMTLIVAGSMVVFALAGGMAVVLRARRQAS